MISKGISPASRTFRLINLDNDTLIATILTAQEWKINIYTLRKRIRKSDGFWNLAQNTEISDCEMPVTNPHLYMYGVFGRRNNLMSRRKIMYRNNPFFLFGYENGWFYKDF